MIQQRSLVLFSLLSISLLIACSKSSTTPTPTSPVVGQFDISRVELTGFPTSFTAYNTVVTSATALGTDSYVFANDNSFTNTYTTTTGGLNTQTGSYMYASASQTVTLTPVPSSGLAPQPYALLYNSTANELSTGKLASQDSLANPVTGQIQLVPYYINYVYTKK